MIGGLRDAGKTVLLTTHYMFEADELCDRIAVVARGEIVAQGTPRDLKAAVGDGAIVEIEVYGIGDDALAAVRALDGVTGVVVEERDQAQAIVIQTAVGAEVTQAIMAQLDGVRLGRVTTREPTLEDAYVALVTDHGPDGSRVSQLLRTMTLGWKLHFKQESRNPFFLYIVIGTPLIYATMAYFLFQGGEKQATLVAAAVGSAMMGIWSLTTTAAAAALQRQRRLGILELLVASPTPFWATFLPITLAIASIGIYSLATGLIYVRFLFGVPVSVDGLAGVHRRRPADDPLDRDARLPDGLGVRPLPRRVDGRQPVRVPGLDDLRLPDPAGAAAELGRAGRLGARSDLGDERAPQRRARHLGLARHRDVRAALDRSTPCSAGCC